VTTALLTDLLVTPGYTQSNYELRVIEKEELERI